MSDYVHKLSAIADKKQRLLETEQKLIEKRKKEIGGLIEKMELLTVPDPILTGLFLELQSALKDNSDKVKMWEHQGAQAIRPKPIHSKPT